jgi:GH35 family endo-1,4-beta-xylanase
MQRHAYGFGAAVDPKTLFREGPDADRFREVIVRDFNRVVIPNHLKWTYWKRDRETGLRALAWLREHGLDVRGHTLVWPAKKNMPASTLALFEQPEALRRAILDHIADIATATRGQLIEWDVLNEPVTKTDVQQVLGAEFFTECFHAARRADPAAKLYVNDYSILETGGYDTPHQDGYFATIRALLEARAPLEGIGMQSHFNENLTPIPRLAEILDRFATFGLPIEVTEFDVDTFDEQLQADYTRDFMTLVFSHPSTVGILTWGFWEKAHYIPNAALHRADWSLRPAGAVWYDLVFREWWTPEQQAVTDARGEIHLRGFHGDYAIEVLGAAHTARLRGAQSRVEIALPNPEPPASR